MLELSHVSRSFDGPAGRVQVLEDITLSLAPGQFLAIRGPSGCGKSTLLLTCSALLAPDKGTVKLDGQDLYGLSSEKRAAFRARHIGIAFQRYHLVPYLSVLDNVLTAALAQRRPDARGHAMALLERFALADRRDHVPAQLSTGERQRTALARALLNRPRLLLADEPTGNLDPENAETVLDALTQYAADGGAVLLVTHDPSAAARATRQLTMRAGRLEEAGCCRVTNDESNPKPE